LLCRLSSFLAKKDSAGYEAWLKVSPHRNRNESSSHLATDGKKQYEVVATLEEDGWHMIR